MLSSTLDMMYRIYVNDLLEKLAQRGIMVYEEEDLEQPPLPPHPVPPVHVLIVHPHPHPVQIVLPRQPTPWFTITNCIIGYKGITITTEFINFVYTTYTLSNPIDTVLLSLCCYNIIFIPSVYWFERWMMYRHINNHINQLINLHYALLIYAFAFFLIFDVVENIHHHCYTQQSIVLFIPHVMEFMFSCMSIFTSICCILLRIGQICC